MTVGIARMRTRRARTDDGIGLTGAGDLPKRLTRRNLPSIDLVRL